MEQQYSIDNLIKTKEFSDFYKISVDFCEFIEKYQSKDNLDFLKNSRQNLLFLYSSALALPWVDLQTNIDYDEKINTDQFNKTVSFITDRLGETRYYWHVFDPTLENEKEPVCGDLVDDLQDIYKDIKISILTYNLNKKDCKENALWQFKFDFDKHWDNHCINALSAIHFFLQNE
ncbi:MAG: DUF5063 domain-containing protein [Bacteroidota bacterium]